MVDIKTLLAMSRTVDEYFDYSVCHKHSLVECQECFSNLRARPEYKTYATMKEAEAK